MRLALALVPLALAALAACAERRIMAPRVDCPRFTTLEISVSAGTTPSFTWSPACSVQRVSVWEEDGAAQSMWILLDSIPSGVRYGVVPSGSRELDNAKSLVPGVRYRVSASNFEASGGAATGQAAFVP